MLTGLQPCLILHTAVLKTFKLKEQQTREAWVELALERVRARTLAMQKSDELAETSSELFRQMIGLGIEPNCLKHYHHP